MQFVHAVLSLHIAQNSQISQTSQTVRSGFDQFVLWYGNLPQLAQTAITVVVGAIVSYLVFKIVARLVKGLVTAVIAAIGAVPNARRAAAAHVLFNLLTGTVALLLLPWLVDALAVASDWFGLTLAASAALRTAGARHPCATATPRQLT